ncbi:unnamed protein product [Blepharisma stoltei]|uniref:AAA+ ATPase domain-containing protein n=1 Tax=Blepharisma stoltei TaxID=1481888 RepID=A0AAU9JC01_9CILI|nr:unnamed protein product [Blepharisma stoltei]
MSEELRKTLASRLRPGDRFTNKGLSRNSSSSTLTVSKPKQTLMPRLQSLNQSTTNIKKPKTLEPISPFFKSTVFSPAMTVMTKSGSMIFGEDTKKLPKLPDEPKFEPIFSSTKGFKAKNLPPLKAQPKRKHIHGESRSLIEDEMLNTSIPQNPTPYDFIQVIKSDPELMEDFWYCNRKGGSYDFELVPFKKKNPNEYLTISSRGVTHFISGEAYFLSLEEWEREYKLYQRLKEIRFFKQYKKWKNFSLWKNLRRRNMMTERSQFLEHELFILDNKLRDPLLNVRHQSWKILRFDLLDLNFDNVRTIEQFNAAQDTKRIAVGDELEDLETNIKNLVSISCKESLEAFRRENKTTVNDEEGRKGVNEDADPFLVGDISNKQMPYTQEAIIRTHYKRLAKFIRLCDYQIIDAKMSLSIQSAQKVLKVITFDYDQKDKKPNMQRRQQSPLLVINADFELRNIFYEPDNEAVKVAIDDAILRGLTMLLNNYMLVSVPEFERYTKALEEFEEKPVDEDFDLLQMIVNDDIIKRIGIEIKDGIDRSFRALIKFSLHLIPNLDIYMQNYEMNVERYRDAEIEEIKKAIDEYLRQMQEFKTMKEEEDVGIFQLHVQNIKRKLIPSPNQCMEKIEGLLPEIALDSAMKLTKVLGEYNNNIKGVPKTVEEYIYILKHMKEIENNLQDITNRTNDLKDLMQLMETYSIKFTDLNKRKYNETLTSLDALRTKMQAFYERGENDKTKFTRMLRDSAHSVDKRNNDIKELLKDEMFANKDANKDTVIEILTELGEKVTKLVQDTKDFRNYYLELEMEPKEYPEVEDTFKDWKNKNEMWRALDEWEKKIIIWSSTPFNKIDVEQITREVDGYNKIAKRCKSLEDQGNYVPQVLKSYVDVLKDTMPIVSDLRFKGLEERHWEQIRKVIGIDIDIRDESFTLKKLLDIKVNNVKEEISEIALRARKEEEIQNQLSEIVSGWDNIEFHVEKVDESYIFKEVDDIMVKLEDSQAGLSTLISNRFIGPMFEKVDYWNKIFKIFAATLDEWLLCQKQWGELDKIFKSGDIAKKLNKSYKVFQTVDTFFKERMKKVWDSPNALKAATEEGLLKNFQDTNKNLEKLQKKIEEHLDKQRVNFPRFFFLSNDELLIILSNSQNVREIQTHLKNMFENIYELEFEEEKTESFTGLISAERETLTLHSKIKSKGNPDEWLKVLEMQMNESLRRYIREAIKKYGDLSRKEFILSPDLVSQVILCTAMIMWTWSTEENLSGKSDVNESLTDWHDVINGYLEELTNLVREELTLAMRRRIVALVTQDVHNRDTVEMLKDEEVTSAGDFRWQKHLRYYWADFEEKFKISQLNADLEYGFEFMGATTRLVITPLTDRCWMTITGAMKINLGAAPAGPAGTGKTESVKDLAKAMGKYCIVFNCSEQITYQMMEKLFMGLCYTGSWSCLDEFNRIDIEVLSVIAQQLRVIKQSKDDNKQEFFFEDKKVALKAETGVFITMNPNYAGRTELPDNLKVLFRPVSMMVPDYTLIAEIMLYAEGFKNAKHLSGKMTKLYKLASEQLSQQDHYDFGMRAVKSVLNMAGALKRKEPHLTEDIILIRAMKDSNVPKFLKEDLVLFNAIVQDLFPEAEIPSADCGDLELAIRECIGKDHLQPIDTFVNKVIQLFETFEVRFGVMIVGPATAGKTTCYKILAHALSLLRSKNSRNQSYQKVQFQVLNPKAISMGELYGEYNEITLDWKDGLASSIMREFSKKEELTRRWVVFDGPVDSLWIENMNTVLDDNMMLCLANQERIKLKPEMRMLFEVADLASASPATVSRCGMVYMNIEAVGWKALIQTWIAKELAEWQPEQRDHLIVLINTYMGKALSIMQRLTEPIPTMTNSLIASFCKLLNAVAQFDRNPRFNDNIEQFKKYLDKIFVFCLTWSIGGALDTNGMIKFDSAISSELNVDLPKGSLYDSCVVSTKVAGDYKSWDNMKTDFVYNPEASYFQLLVPTKDTIRFEHLLKYNISIQHPVFITGYTGVGKSVIITNTLISMKETDNLYPIFITFSAQTSSLYTQNSIVNKLDAKRKDLLGGPGTKKVALLIDDVNMPAVEKFGAQPPIELLRQFCDQGFIYDREKKFALRIIDTTLICCAAPPEGGRSKLTQRFTRHFHMLCIPHTSEENMITIFKTICDGFFSRGWKTEVIASVPQIVSATIHIYQQISAELLPTPAKSHYLFNLRDVSKVFQGLLMGKPRTLNNPDMLINLWIHETMRVFHDRLINKQDKRWFTEMVTKMLGQHFRLSATHDQMFEEKTIMFADFLRGDLAMEDREYEMVTSSSTLNRRIGEFLDEYNSIGTHEMKLVFFNDAIEHLSRLCRILRQQRGNAMLIGVGGCGKQSLTKLASFMCHCEFFQIQVTKDYKLSSFRDDLKKLFIAAGGVVPKPSVFLLTDTQIISESFLEDINNILNSGEVPNLFTKEELDPIEQDLRTVAEREKVFENIYNFFIQRVRENLHIVLCMSPVGDSLRVRMRMFPSLVNCCTIDWVDPWPNDALLSVSESKLQDLTLDFLPKEESINLKKALAKLCVEVHQSVIEMADEFYQILNRKVYITPKSYIDLIAGYFKLLEEKQNELSSARQRYRNGVDQLIKTNIDVQEMQKTLVNLAPVLEQNKTECEELGKKLEIDTVQANKVREIVEDEEKEVNMKTQEIKVLQEDAEADLNQAMPILEEAIRALGNINSKDIAEIRTFASPPKLVVFTLETIAILLEAPTSLESIRKILQNNFLDTLMKFPKDSIKPVTLKKLKNKIASLPDFTPEKVGGQNVASKSLCEWVYAIVNYAQVSKEVEPKRKRLEELNKTLADAIANLTDTQNRLKVEQDKVAELEAKFKAVLDQQIKLDNEIQTTNLRLSRASVLTEGLKDEHQRWKVSVDRLTEKLRNILGDIYLSAACINYYGPFSGLYRNKLVSFWMSKCAELGIPFSSNFDLQEVMGDPLVIREWNIATLPTDSVSVCNAILVTRSERWPLMIDPQEQANRWIRKMEESKGLKIIKQTDKDFERNLKTCLREGLPVLIEDIGETLNPLLDPVLNKHLVEQSPGRFTLRMGEADIDYDLNFKLYIITKLSNPHYLPEISIRVSLINFTVTMQGLEEQLLGDVVRKEEPKIEIEQNKLIKDIGDGQRELKNFEQLILQSLSATEGNILDDAKLIARLDTAKKSSDLINKRMITAENTKKENEAARAKYQKVARRGSILYFVIADLANIDPMYQYSLSYFSKFFNAIIDQAPASADPQARIEILITAITEVIYSNICRGLFNAHKLIFSFLLAAQIQRDAGLIKEAEWAILLRGVTMLPADFRRSARPDIAGITEKSWNFVIFLQNISEPFMNPPIGKEMLNNKKEWQTWINSKDPHKEPLPGTYNNLSIFQKMLLIKAFRDEKIIYMVSDFINEVLGPKFVQVAPTSMEEVYAETTKRTPIIFILSQGADPMSMITRLARDRKFLDRIDPISLGKGQDEKAKKAIEKGLREGKWVILQNCHLAKSWMPDLEKQIENFDDPKSAIHEEFRIFLTSMPCNYFPIPVLQNGVKVTIEPPKGIKSNLLRSMALMTDEKLSESSKPEIWQKLIFSLCLFHAVIQERRKFGPLGWNIRYEFNESDLETSIRVIENFLNEQEIVPWEAIKFVTGEINYGGRVTDDLDRRCLMSTLSYFMKPEILDDAFKFSESGIYAMPSETSIQAYKDFVMNLPNTDEPEIFGMHENANITFQQQESASVLNAALLIQPKEKGKSSMGKTPDEMIDELAAKFLEELPKVLMKSEAGSHTFVVENGLMEAMATFLGQEMERFNRLLVRCKTSLEDLRKAIQGLVLMSDDLDKMYNAMNNNSIPELWNRVAYPSLKPLASWFSDLKERVSFIRRWLIHGKPESYWLSSFFFPQGFLTSVMQSHSRKFRVPIDNLIFTFEMQSFTEIERIEEKIEDGVYVHGLYMEGCRWEAETNVLEDSKPGVMWTLAPLISFIPSEVQDNVDEEEEYYLMPVYKTSVRAGQLSTTGHSTNYIISIDVPTHKKPQHWIQRGAAFLCQLND